MANCTCAELKAQSGSFGCFWRAGDGESNNQVFLDWDKIMVLPGKVLQAWIQEMVYTRENAAAQFDKVEPPHDLSLPTTWVMGVVSSPWIHLQILGDHQPPEMTWVNV